MMENFDDTQFRPSKKILGMAVYSVQEGQNLGQVKSLVIDAKEKRLLALVVEKRRLTKEEKLLPFTAVKNVGEDVVTVERGQVLERRGVDPAVVRALRRPVQPLGARCFTAGGKTMGKVEEYYVEVNSGRIAQLEISDGGLFKGKMLLDGKHIIALAPHTVMLDDEAYTNCRPLENNLLSTVELARGKAASTAKNTVSMLGNSLSRIKGGAKEEAEEERLAEEPVTAETVTEEAVTEEVVPEETATAEAIFLPPAAKDAPGSPAKSFPITVEVLIPEEVREQGRPVQLELPDLVRVEPAQPVEAAETAAPGHEQLLTEQTVPEE